MAATQKVIMAWSECEIEIAKAQEDGNFPTTGLTKVGVIKDKSSTLEPSDGDKLEMKKPVARWLLRNRLRVVSC